MKLSVFTMFYSHHHYVITENFHLSKGKPQMIRQWLHFLPSFQPLAIPNLLSVSMNLTILDISYKRNHIICDLLCLASYTWHNIFCVPPCSMYQNFAILWLNNILLYRILYYILFIHSLVDGHWVVSTFWLLWTVLPQTVIKKFSLWAPIFNYFRYIPRSGILGSHGNSMFHSFNFMPLKIAKEKF